MTNSSNSGQPCRGAILQHTRCFRPAANAPFGDEVAEDDQEQQRTFWHLVWCQERSCKAEMKELRDSIDKLAHEAGGRCFCMKKARAYSAWRTRIDRRTPHVLLTDRREVKPCIQAMASSSSVVSSWNRPLLVVVLMEDDRSVERLKMWLQASCIEGGNELVHIIRNVDELHALVAKVLPDHGRPSSVGSFASVVEEPSYCHMGRGRAEGECQKMARVGGSPLVSLARARGLPLPVVGVLFSACAWKSASQVENDLEVAATSQFYED